MLTVCEHDQPKRTSRVNS